jgi:predicted RNase H-like HicB family nuclease
MNEPTVSAYLEQARRYTAVVVPDEEDGLFVARAADFPGAVGAGTTRDEAVEEMANGIAAMLEHAAKLGLAVPPPMRDYTGAVSVRLPKSLHVALAQRAEAEGLSVNATVTYLLTQALELQGTVRAPRRRPRAKQAV